MTRVALQPAYVLHGKPYRDTSLLIEAFTPQHGRLGLVARGARTARSRLRGLLQPFRPLLMSWTGKGDLLTLEAAEEHGIMPVLKGDALLSGFYLNELLLRLLQRHDPHPALLDRYDAALRVLAEYAHQDTGLQRVLRGFERHLLQETGYGLVLDRDVATGLPIAAEGVYRYDLERGPVRYTGGDAALILQGRSLIALAGDALDDAVVLREAKRLLREALAVHLGPRPLRSRELYSELKDGFA
ncbi:MAG: DNA repair protein RecO [Gammaproteobacteria bacterium]|nr:DNA repair protein RecO [Gammaproteobacteria bacterium]